MIFALFQLQCVNLMGWGRWTSADPLLIGEGGGWFWVDVSDDKAGNSVSMSVQSASGTCRW